VIAAEEEVHSMTDMDGKVALVTGAGSGIGRATSVLFAEKGAKVALADVNVAGGEETLEMNLLRW